MTIAVYTHTHTHTTYTACLSSRVYWENINHIWQLNILEGEREVKLSVKASLIAASKSPHAHDTATVEAWERACVRPCVCTSRPVISEAMVLTSFAVFISSIYNS